MTDVEALKARVDALESELEALRGEGKSDEGGRVYETLGDFRSRDEKLDFIKANGVDAFIEIVNRTG